MKKSLKYVFEVLAIFLGITISFVVDEWREERQIKTEMVNALNIIKDDLTNELSMLEEMYEFNRSKMESISELLAIQTSNNIDTISNYGKYLLVPHFIYEDYVSFDAGYKRLISISDTQFSNDNIIQLLSKHYSQDRMNQVNQIVNDFYFSKSQPFMEKHTSLTTRMLLGRYSDEFTNWDEVNQNFDDIINLEYKALLELTETYQLLKMKYHVNMEQQQQIRKRLESGKILLELVEKEISL